VVAQKETMEKPSSEEKVVVICVKMVIRKTEEGDKGIPQMRN